MAVALIIILLVNQLAFLCLQQSIPNPTALTPTRYTAPIKFDPNRNSLDDLSASIEAAKRTKRNVLIEVGGEWCEWCHILDDFYAKNPDLIALRDKYYVLMKADVSESHPNSKFLSLFPQIDGFPHLFVLDTNGKLVHSEDTSELEDGESYSVGRFKKFLEKYAPENQR